jgi:hypothetical protein
MVKGKMRPESGKREAVFVSTTYHPIKINFVSVFYEFKNFKIPLEI